MASEIPLVVGSPEDEHAIGITVGGRYICAGCDYDSLNRWGAEAHYEENHGELDGGDKPGWL